MKALLVSIPQRCLLNRIRHHHGFSDYLINVIGMSGDRANHEFLTLLQGMLVGWGILSPLSKLSGWAPGPVNDMTSGARGWILWISLAIMCSDSIVSLSPVISEIVYDKLSKYTGSSLQGVKEDKEVETPDRLVPLRWVVWGSAVSVIVGTILVWMVFGNEGIKPWATVIGFLMGGILSIFG